MHLVKYEDIHVYTRAEKKAVVREALVYLEANPFPNLRNACAIENAKALVKHFTPRAMDPLDWATEP